MNCNELATVATQDLPIVILLFNNNALGMVRQWQNLFSHKRYSETDIYDKTNYIMLANAYGIEGHKAQNLEELNQILENLTPRQTSPYRMSDRSRHQCIPNRSTKR